MTDWKAVGLGAIINAVLTIVLALAIFPLFFLGPVIGGFITSYMSEDKTRPVRGNPTEGAADGAISGVIGGLIIGIIFILGFGALSAIIGLVFEEIGLIVGTITLITGLFITLISVLIGGVLGAIGGVIGYSTKEKGYVVEVD